jgi:hypothetical protein
MSKKEEEEIEEEIVLEFRLNDKLELDPKGSIVRHLIINPGGSYDTLYSFINEEEEEEDEE